MKVISGKYKGRNLVGFDILGTRPTMDRVKESLFGIIQNDINGSVVLDLFAGSGNLGIEALSEGAQYAYFVDKNRKAYAIIRENLKNLGIGKEEAAVFCMDSLKQLREFSNHSFSFDIIFIDPPYQTNLVEVSIASIVQLNLLKKDGMIVAESDSLDRIVFPSCLKIVKSRKYGDKWVAILRFV